MVRAVMEGTILNLGYGFSRMKTLGLIPSEIRATGGGSKSGLWLQIVADIFQTPVRTFEEDEAAAFGAAIQSIWNYYRNQGDKVKISDLTERMVKMEDKVVQPRPETFSLYEELQERFNSLWKSLEQEFQAHRQSSSQNNA
jgi:xylulokinase